MHSDSFIKFYSKYIKSKRSFKKFEKIFRNLGINPNQIETTVIEHQLAHAATAYRSSQFLYDKEDILIVTVDGSGDGLSSPISIGIGKEIETAAIRTDITIGETKRIAFSSYYDSIGNAFYTEITKYLGLNHENTKAK